MNPPTPQTAPAAGGGSAPTLEPVASGERVVLIDVLRGFAIFGILLVNMGLFFSPVYDQFLSHVPFPGALDEAARKLIVFFAQAKFYPMFSFLFGMGLAIQMERTAARGRPVAGFFSRRMAWLLAIGLAHAFLLWFGDILVLYSLLGFLLLLFRKRKPRTLAVWTVILLLIPVLLIWTYAAYFTLAQQLPESATQAESIVAAQQEVRRAASAEAYQVYATGSWDEVFVVRATEWATVNLYVVVAAAPTVLALFLIGLNVGRRRFFQRLPEGLPTARRWIVPLAIAGVAGNLVGVLLLDRVNPSVPSVAFAVQQTALAVGGPALCFTYVLGLTLLWQRSGGRRLLAPLAPVGRMALSNYLLHSVVFTTLSYGYGFGLYGRIMPATGLAMTLAIYLLQIPLSAWWLRRFRFGPLEWLWRSLTYGKLQPMRR